MERRRTIMTYLVSLALLLGSLAFSASAQTISIDPGNIEANQGDSFTIDIKVDPEGTEISGAQYVLYFDSRMLNATLQTQGSFLGGNTLPGEIDNLNGTVDYGEYKTGGSGVTNPGVLASVTFEVIGTSGTSYLKLSDVILSDRDGNETQVAINQGSFSTKREADDPTPAPQSAVNPIVAEEAHQMMEETPEEIILLDVRTKDEHDAEYIRTPDAELMHIPLSELESRLGEPDKSKKIIVYSKNGADSRTASGMLAQHGFEHVYNMLGGIEEWRINFPVISLSAPMSTPTVAPSATPAPSSTAAASPTASPTLASTPASTPILPGAKSGLPGFEAVFAIIGLLMVIYLIPMMKKR